MYGQLPQAWSTCEAAHRSPCCEATGARRVSAQRTLDKSRTPIFLMFLNDSREGLSFLTELQLRVEGVLDLILGLKKLCLYWNLLLQFEYLLEREAGALSNLFRR